jgi:hypothetical protein
MPLGSFRLNSLAKRLVAALFTRSQVNPKVWASDSNQFHNFGKFGRAYWSTPVLGVLPFEVRDLGSAQTWHNQDTTWEAWVYPVSWSANAATGEGSANVMGNAGGDGWVYNQFGFNNAGKLTFGYAYNNSFSTYATVQQSGTSGVLNTWQHIAMVQSGGNISLYYNGTRVAGPTAVVGTPSYDFGNARGFSIGATYATYHGYLEEIRVSHTARYTGASFTAPTAPFVNDSFTKLLYHNDNTAVVNPNGSTISGHDDADGTYAFNGDFITAVTAVSLIGSTNSIASTIAIPAFAMVNDYAFLFDRSGTTTNTIPSGWTSIVGTTTTGIRSNISYKKLVSGDLGTTITGMGGTVNKVLVIVRPNGPVGSVSLSTPTGVATTAVPTNQTISMSGQTRPIMGFAHYTSTGNIVTRTGTGNEAEYSAASGSGRQYVKTWCYNASTAANITIGMSDGGTNILQGFWIRFIP